MFPNAFNQYGDLLNWEQLFILRSKVEESFGVFTVTIEKLGSLQHDEKDKESCLIATINHLAENLSN